MVDISFLIASMYVFFEYIALHENPFKNSTNSMWVKREKTCFFFPMDADLWVSRDGTNIVARWIWFSSCRSTLASVVRVSLSPSWTRSGRDPGLWGRLFVKGGWIQLGWDPSGGVMFFFLGGGAF